MLLLIIGYNVTTLVNQKPQVFRAKAAYYNV